MRIGAAAVLFLLSLNISAQNAAEQRGAWLATVDGLDWPRKQSLHYAQRSDLIATIDSLAALGCNTLYFQVVSEMDAMYSSDILPWSRHLSGEEGMTPYFDPLGLAVKAAHRNGMQIHAWINPLRVSISDTTVRSISQIKYVHPEWVHNYRGKEYLDPGNPEVVDFLCRVAAEILSRYDVDGLHIDDYFYPDGLQSDRRSPSDKGAWDDSALYALYGGGKTLEEWRFGNIDRLVAALHETTRSVRPDAVFGVSPQGRIANSRRLYADPRRWAGQGSVDYLLPQLYWSTGRNDAAAFPKVLPEWEALASERLIIYVGLAAYKHDPVFYRRKQDAGFRDTAEYRTQVELLRNRKKIHGHVWFRTRDILEREDLKAEISRIYKNR